MKYTSLASWVRAVAIATMVVSVALAALIVAAEEVPALKDWLKATFYHHWLGKGALTLIAFSLMSLTLHFRRDLPSPAAIVAAEAIVVAIAACAIAGFFLLHLLKLI